MNRYLYKVVERDDAFDPLDWGVLVASDLGALKARLRKHLAAVLGLGPTETQPLHVDVHVLGTRPIGHGVLPTIRKVCLKLAVKR